MTKRRNRLVFVILVELVVAGWFGLERVRRPRPPTPGLSGYHPYVAHRIREDIEECDINSPADWAHLGDVFVTMGFYPEAEACFRQGVVLAPNSPDLRYRWAFGLSIIGHLENAAGQFAEAMERGYARPYECWYFLGMDALRREDVEAARRAFRSAGPLSAAQFELARLSLEDGQAEAALPLIETLQKQHPNAWRIHDLRARAEAELGNHVDAVAYHELADRSSGLLPGPWKDRDEQLLRLYEQRSPENLVTQGVNLLGRGRVDEAAALVQAPEWASSLSDAWDPGFEDLLANVAVARGNRQEQIDRLADVVQRAGGDSYRCCRLGFALLSAGQRDEAIRWFNTGIRLNSAAREREIVDMYEQLSELAVADGRHDEAQRTLARARFFQGVDLFRWRRIPEAEAAFTESTRLDSSSADSWFYLGEIHRVSGRSDAARAAYERAITLRPNYGRALRAKQRPGSGGDQ